MSESDRILGHVGDVYPDSGSQETIVNEMFEPIKAKSKAVRLDNQATEWLDQIDMCERAYQETFSNARQNLAVYKNRRVQRISIPLLTPMVEIKSALSTFRDPYISVRPRKKAVPTSPEEVLASAVKESYINWLWRNLDLKREVRRIVRDTLLLTGRGIGTPGYNVLIDPTQVITHDTVVLNRTSPFDYYLDIEADSSSNAFYGIRRMIMPIWLAAKTFRKPESAFQEVRYSKWSKHKDQDREMRNKNRIKRLARTTVFEIQDLTMNMFYFVTPGYPGFLERFDNPYPIDGLVPEFLEPMPVPDEIFCVDEAGLIRPQLDELTSLRNFWMELWKKEVPKYLIEIGAANSDQVEKLISAEHPAFEFVNDVAGIRLLEMPRGSTDLHMHEERIKQDISEITGWNQYMQGAGSPGGRRTAYEVREIIAGSNVRISDLNDSVEQFCSKVARKMLQIASRFVGPEEMQQIVGLPVDLQQLGLPTGFSIDQTLINDDTDVTILSGSMQLPSKETDMQRAMLLQNFLAFPETNRFAVLQEMATLMDLNPLMILQPQENVDPAMQEEHRQAQMGGGGGRDRQTGGAVTGSIMGERPRPELIHP